MARVLEEGYNNATRVKLDITLEAPIIVLPVSSRKPFTFEANTAIQHYAPTISLDTMTVTLTNMNVSRTKIAEDTSDNSTVGSCEIIKPIDFELEVTRNMDGAIKEEDIELYGKYIATDATAPAVKPVANPAKRTTQTISTVTHNSAGGRTWRPGSINHRSTFARPWPATRAL